MLKKLGLLFILSAIISCNFHIEKRKYFKGYHVEIAKSQKATTENSNTPYFKQTDYNPTQKSISDPLQLYSQGVSSNAKITDSSKDKISSQFFFLRFFFI